MEQTSTRTSNQTMLRAFIEAEADRLLGILRHYLVRANLTDQRGATLGATELLNEVVVEALEHADRFRPSGQPMAWLLGIAANLIKPNAQRAIAVSPWCEICIQPPWMP
jgi:DNA-directed RNA polymerase specialized sigma24 family protein